MKPMSTRVGVAHMMPDALTQRASASSAAAAAAVASAVVGVGADADARAASARAAARSSSFPATITHWSSPSPGSASDACLAPHLLLEEGCSWIRVRKPGLAYAQFANCSKGCALAGGGR